MIRRPPRSTLFPSRISSTPSKTTSSATGVDEIREGPRRTRREQLERSVEGLTLRSEEHTSELQSRLHLVCRLLLEKKNSTTTEAKAKSSAPPSLIILRFSLPPEVITDAESLVSVMTSHVHSISRGYCVCG